MKEVINHPSYGEIVYDESIWTGKKIITVNGTTAPAVSKKEFMIDGKKAVVKASATIFALYIVAIFLLSMI